MTLSAIDKIDALSANKSAQKAIGDYSYVGYGGYIPSGDLPRDEYGAAAAYAVVVEIFTAIAVWENYLDGIVWVIKDKSTGTEIARTDAKEYPLHEPGGKWFRAIKSHERNYYYSYFKRQAQSDWLFGNTYNVMLPAERQYRPTSTNYVGLRWLNPLNVSQMVIGGTIQQFQYSSMDNEISGQIPPSQMAYHINRANLFDDLQGYSGILAAMDNINLYRNSIRAFKNFFSQGMQLGGVIMPLPEQKWSDREMENARREWANNHKGAANAGRWAILPAAAQITPYGQEDASSNFAVTKDLRDLIYSAVSVFPQLAGNPSDATFDNAEHIKRQWWQMLANPYARDIGGYNSDVVIPKLEPDAGIYVEPDLSPYEIEEPEIIAQDFNAGIIDIATAQAKRGYTVDKDIAEAVIYNIGGRPMSKAVMLQLSNQLPANEVQQYAQADKYQAEATSIEKAPVESPALPSEKPLPAGWTEENAVGNEAEIEAALNAEALHHKHAHDLLPEIDHSPITDEMRLTELQAWRKFLSNGKSQKRPFCPKALCGDIADLLQDAIATKDRQATLDAFVLAEKRIQTKAIQATRLGFEDDFNRLLTRARTERMGRVQWASAMRVILRRYGTKAYIDGLSDGGVDVTEDELPQDDRIAINQLNASNSGYVTELGSVLYKEDGVTDNQADIKAELWWNKSLNPYYQAGLISADGNSLYEWYIGRTEKHCPSCLKLNGQRHRLKDWQANILPKSSDLDCEGWLCDCGLMKARGRARGNYLA